jgi:hypothetical protein
MRNNCLKPLVPVIACLMLAGSVSHAADSYYKETPMFHMYPDPDGARYVLKRFGPVGIGLDLRQPAFTMYINNVEEGSPAAATGKLKKGQIIESINGQKLRELDPRVILGNLITEAEASDGKLHMKVKDDPKADAQTVVVQIPVLGAYSETWPVNCPKSDKIVRTFADYLAANKESAGIGLDGGAMLFMLSTGEDKDLDVVRKWIKGIVDENKDKDEIKTYPWFAGYTGPALCEYYLRTGDESIIPVIEKVADYLKRTIYNGSWMGRGGASYGYMGGGHMNAAGVHCLTFLLMAKECGAKVDEHTLQSCLYHFYRYNGRGNVSYGDGLPEGGMTDNGRTTGLAIAMQAAANLHPDGEKSVYANARDINATKGFYSTSWLFHGHTGGGIGELWRGQSMGLIKDKRPNEYQSFMNERRWMYELARTHEGIFGWVSGWNVSYDDTANGGKGWGNYIPLVYTIPRKNLRIYGAPKSKYSKTYHIPDRPWGNEADDVFYSLEAGEYKPGKRQDVSKERLVTDASMPILARLGDPGVDDDTLLMYAHHIDQGIRSGSARAINNHERYHLIVPLLKSKDPRGRLAGITCIVGMNKGRAIPDDQLTDEMISLISDMIKNPNESWWVKESAFKAMGRARSEQVAKVVDDMMPWLDHKDWWLQAAAIHGLAPLIGDKKYTKPILAKACEAVVKDPRGKVAGALPVMTEQIQKADDDVKQYAREIFAKAYLDYPAELSAPGGQELTQNVPELVEKIARALVATPGGYDDLYKLSPKRFPGEALPHEDIFFAASSDEFGPELKKAFIPIILKKMIPQYIDSNRKNLEKELESHQPGRAVDGLVDLYNKAGIKDYNWMLHGTRRDKIDWDYLTFDPPEKMLWEAKHRFRPVTLPANAQNWFMPDFDPKASGWKTGHAPFANKAGKLSTIGDCIGADHFCGCGNEPATFWDKEVLLMRSELKMPAMEDGYAYRLLVGGRSHYNAGGGTDIWIDGVHIPNRRKGEATVQGGSGRNSGVPWGVVIDDQYREHFADGKVLVACNGFLRWGHKLDYIQSYQAIWFEKMKLPTLPPLTD